MKKALLFLLMMAATAGTASPLSGGARPISVAVEFNDHAACAYVALEKGWFRQEGLDIKAFKSYITGMALAAALARGDIEVAYLCLVPALNAYANARVPIKIVAGTHKYGYGLVVDPKKVKSVHDLEKRGIRIGCSREGSPVDVLLHRLTERYGLKSNEILRNLWRMNPPKQVLAIKLGRLEAAFLPEQWATMAEGLGFKMLLTAQEIWPDMQGSVLVVKQELLRDHPEVVEKLVRVNLRATEWINLHPKEAAELLARQLSVRGKRALPVKAPKAARGLEITPEVLARSMARLQYTLDIEPKMVQDVIDYMVQLGYVRRGFKAEEILDLKFLR